MEGVDESDPVSAALMHLFYYQQGLFADDVEPSLLQEVAGAPGSHPWRPAQNPAPLVTVQDFTAGVGPPPPPPPVTGATATGPSRIQALRARRAELQWRIETGALKTESEALESHVSRMQRDFNALTDEFKDMKERFGERLADVNKALEAQQEVTAAAERRVICTEDLVRFYEEQRRQMAGHWKAQCQMKDERIRSLNLQLTQYTVDWQHLGTHKQTDASRSHELQCLQDRHDELRIDCERRREKQERLALRLADFQAEAKELRESEAEAVEAATKAEFAKAAAEGSMEENASKVMELRRLQASTVGLRGQLRLLNEWARKRENAEPETTDPPWPHKCIWRDELDVREKQLEKITAQLDRTNNALHAAREALSAQRERHEDMKNQHREAEVEHREGERRRAKWQRQCAELRRAEAELRCVLEASSSSSASAAASGSVSAGGASGTAAGMPGPSSVGGMSAHGAMPAPRERSSFSAGDELEMSGTVTL
eukprot:TRINITY_DN67934_c0_g1_i1.p1 TRINITY_DN67934_c0_g1~~TRINITY_DN67934_c0_g1_i1.p1  ORF type:complete len:487 (+),score=106.62 TRINITY_DN67934_c0_g1_i1:109-1569(+)